MSSPKARERSAEDHRPRLGRGLAALLADPTVPGTQGVAGREHRTVPVEFLKPNPRNPRRQFDGDELRDLAESIRAKGILQPIIARTIPNVAGSYEIIAGERRWRAAQAAEQTEVPVIVVEADDREALAFAIIENVQRADLNAIEEAQGYERLGREFDYSQSDLSTLIGKSRSHVANTLRLLKLPQPVLDHVAAGALTAGHARALLAFCDPAAMAERAIAEGLTVRELEALAQREQEEAAAEQDSAAPARPRTPPSEASRVLAAELSAALGLAVSHKAKGEAGEIRIRYSSEQELQALREALARSRAA
jgi:ParB family chromosome partitioning protein